MNKNVFYRIVDAIAKLVTKKKLDKLEAMNIRATGACSVAVCRMATDTGRHNFGANE